MVSAPFGLLWPGKAGWLKAVNFCTQMFRWSYGKKNTLVHAIFAQKGVPFMYPLVEHGTSLV